MEIIAESPGDISVIFTSEGIDQAIPLKSLSVQKSTDVNPEYGTGYHLPYALVQGKIAYSGDFKIGTWYVSALENPETWMDLIRVHLTHAMVEGLSREFRIVIADNEKPYERSTPTKPTLVNNAGSTIVTYDRCLLKGDSLSIGDVGSTLETSYSFICMRRTPA